MKGGAMDWADAAFKVAVAAFMVATAVGDAQTAKRLSRRERKEKGERHERRP